MGSQQGLVGVIIGAIGFVVMSYIIISRGSDVAGFMGTATKSYDNVAKAFAGK
jgi:hypothetical protein